MASRSPPPRRREGPRAPRTARRSTQPRASWVCASDAPFESRPLPRRSTARCSRADWSADEVDVDGPLERADRLAAAHQLADGLATFLAVVLGQLVHVHPDEAVAELGVEAPAELERVLHGLAAV